jgi:hypothetical protein
MPDTRIAALTRRKFLIDTDGAADDIIALILALRREDLSIEAITVVSVLIPLPCPGSRASPGQDPGAQPRRF